MARKKKADAEPEVAPTVDTRSPLQWIGLDHGRNGEYEYVAGSRGQRVVNHNGVSYEHCADDLDGCWLYRHAHV